MAWSPSSRSGSDLHEGISWQTSLFSKNSDPSYYYYPPFRWTSESQAEPKLDRLPYSRQSFMTFSLVLGLCYSLLHQQKGEEELLQLPHPLPPLSVPFCVTRKPSLHHNCINSRACPGLGNGVGAAAFLWH